MIYKKNKDMLKNLISMPGISGHEWSVGDIAKPIFSEFCDEVSFDKMGNLIGLMKGSGNDLPKMMFMAHMDRIGLMVTKIEEKGFLRIANVGGVDARLLPSAEVIVHGKSDLKGIVCSVPPHLLSAEDAKKAVVMKDLLIDVNLPVDKVKELVSVGDLIDFDSEYTSLQEPFAAAPAIDDRGGVISLIECMKRLKQREFFADVYFIASVQEEISDAGANAITFNINPDLAIAIDVTHGKSPDADPDETFDMDGKIVIGKGPFLNANITEKLKEVSDKVRIPNAYEIMPSQTYTDASVIGITGAGVPVALLQIPLRYMHTPVEVVNLKTIDSVGEVLAEFVCSEDGGLKWLRD